MAYRAGLIHFAQYLGISPDGIICHFASLSGNDATRVAESYREAMISNGLSPSTINCRLFAIKSLATYTKSLGIIDWALEVQTVRSQPVRDMRGPNPDDVKKMMSMLSRKNDRLSIRDLAIIRLMFTHCLRCNEIRTLDMEHVDLGRGTIYVKGKGRRDREQVALAPRSLQSIKRWVAVRGDARGPLFTSQSHNGTAGARLSRKCFQRIVKNRSREACIGFTRPNGLRHAAITAALDSGIRMRNVAQFARHRNLNTTGIYDDCKSDLPLALSLVLDA